MFSILFYSLSRLKLKGILFLASYCKLLTNSNNNNHLALTRSSFLRDLDTRLDSLEKEAVEQLIQQLQEVSQSQYNGIYI